MIKIKSDAGEKDVINLLTEFRQKFGSLFTKEDLKNIKGYQFYERELEECYEMDSSRR